MFSLQDRMVSMVMDREYDVAVEAVRLLRSGETGISGFFSVSDRPFRSLFPFTHCRLTPVCVQVERPRSSPSCKSSGGNFLSSLTPYSSVSYSSICKFFVS